MRAAATLLALACVAASASAAPGHGLLCSDWYYQVCHSDSDCGQGHTCQNIITHGCRPSRCGCDPATGKAGPCTKDCRQGGLCRKTQQQPAAPTAPTAPTEVVEETVLHFRFSLSWGSFDDLAARWIFSSGPASAAVQPECSDADSDADSDAAETTSAVTAAAKDCRATTRVFLQPPLPPPPQAQAQAQAQASSDELTLDCPPNSAPAIAAEVSWCPGATPAAGCCKCHSGELLEQGACPSKFFVPKTNDLATEATTKTAAQTAAAAARAIRFNRAVAECVATRTQESDKLKFDTMVAECQKHNPAAAAAGAPHVDDPAQCEGATRALWKGYCEEELKDQGDAGAGGQQGDEPAERDEVCGVIIGAVDETCGTSAADGICSAECAEHARIAAAALPLCATHSVGLARSSKCGTHARTFEMELEAVARQHDCSCAGRCAGEGEGEGEQHGTGRSSLQAEKDKAAQEKDERDDDNDDSDDGQIYSPYCDDELTSLGELRQQRLARAFRCMLLAFCALYFLLWFLTWRALVRYVELRYELRHGRKMGCCHRTANRVAMGVATWFVTQFLLAPMMSAPCLTFLLFCALLVHRRRRRRRLAHALRNVNGATKTAGATRHVAILVPNGAEAWAVPVTTTPSHGHTGPPFATETVRVDTSGPPPVGGGGFVAVPTGSDDDVVVGMVVSEKEEAASGQGVTVGIPVP